MIKLSQQQRTAFFSAFALVNFLGNGMDAGRLSRSMRGETLL
jgi:hypothetical protein